MQGVTRAEAREQGLKLYYVGRPCRNGHDAPRYVSTGACAECLSDWRASNRDKCAASQRAYAARNPDKRKEYRDSNLEKVRSAERTWLERNRDKDRDSQRRYRQKHAERVRAYEARYRQENRGRCNAWARAYQLAKEQRTPAWLSDEQRRAIEAFYIEAERLTRETGVPHHVDHRVPIRGRIRGQRGVAVSGLHVPWNLIVLPGPENLSKSCYFDPSLLIRSADK